MRVRLRFVVTNKKPRVDFDSGFLFLARADRLSFRMGCLRLRQGLALQALQLHLARNRQLLLLLASLASLSDPLWSYLR